MKRWTLKLALAVTALTVASPALGHDQRRYPFHPDASNLRQLAIIASDAIEAQGLRYIGAHGTCVKKDLAISSRTGKPGWRHIVCTIRTTHGYVWRVTYHALANGEFTSTYKRLR